MHQVQTVLQRLLENSLFVKAEKCKFHVISVSFLGYIIAQEGLEMDPTKVSAVISWKQLQRFLGFANFYRRFIQGYSTIAAPLTALNSSKTSFRWSSAADDAFQHLKGRFTSAPTPTLLFGSDSPFARSPSAPPLHQPVFKVLTLLPGSDSPFVCSPSAPSLHRTVFPVPTLLSVPNSSSAHFMSAPPLHRPTSRKQAAQSTTAWRMCLWSDCAPVKRWLKDRNRKFPTSHMETVLLGGSVTHKIRCKILL